MALHIALMLIKRVFNKDKNSYYYNIFLEKALYELPEKQGFVQNINVIL